MSHNTLSAKVNRLSDQRRKLSHKKKVAGFKNATDFLNREFEPPVSKSLSVTPRKSIERNDNVTALLLESIKEECCTNNESDTDTVLCAP